MAYAALADLIGATWDSWTAAERARDRIGMQATADHLVWLASEAVQEALRDASSPIARRVLMDALERAAERIEPVAKVLRQAGWR